MFIKKTIDKINCLLENEKNNINQTQQNIDISNQKMLTCFIFIFSVILPFTILTTLVTHNSFLGITNYAFTQIPLLLLIILYKKNVFIKKPLIGLYYIMSIAVLFGIMLSVYVYPHDRTTILLGIFCILPIIYIDKLMNKLVFELIAFLTHTIFSFFLKDHHLLIMDLINSIAFIIVGLFIGYAIQGIKISYFKLEQQLKYERETDILTGLKNRRKLYELFMDINHQQVDAPSSIIMMDIDHFKRYNDTHGHSMGDRFLSSFGRTLLELEKQFNIKFFRYGGEEFVAFLWDYDLKHKEITETIRSNVETMKMKHKCTVSIGYVNYSDFKDVHIENLLELADLALYNAKNTGRNKVVNYKKKSPTSA
ncbi:MAG: GGDEF domain-containing protein [Lachnospiraceae bacterium]